MECVTKRTENTPFAFLKQKQADDKGLHIFSRKYAKK